MKILAASDLHGDERAVKRLAKKAEKEKVDLVIICGDITYFDSYNEGMIGPLLEKGREVVFVAGNHDLTSIDFIERTYKIKNIQFYPMTIGDIGIFGCGGANVGMNILSDNEIAIYLEKGFKKVEKADKKIMVTHMHPKGSTIEKLSFSGSQGIRKAIDRFQPDLHLCGHIHEAEGLEERFGKTLSINVGKEGKIIEL